MTIRKKLRIQLAALVLALFSGIVGFIVHVENLNAIYDPYHIWYGIDILIIVASILIFRVPLLAVTILVLAGLFYFATLYLAIMPGIPLLIAGGLALWSCSADLEATN